MPPSLHILPVVEADVPALAQLHQDALEPVLQGHFIYTSKAAEAELKPKIFLGEIGKAVANPANVVVKAVDATSGEIVGYGKYTVLDGTIKAKSGGNQDGFPPGINEEYCRTLFEGLAKKHNDYMAGKPHIFLNTVMVPPSKQGQGIGSALVKWMTDKADEAGLETYLSSLPAACSVYKKLGFEEVDFFEMDLSQWSKPYEGYGVFRNSEMVRQPLKAVN